MLHFHFVIVLLDWAPMAKRGDDSDTSVIQEFKAQIDTEVVCFLGISLHPSEFV